MKITFFIGSMGMGGAERVISHLSNHFSDLGWNVDIVLLLDNTVEYKLNDDVRIIDLHGKYKSYYKNILFWCKNIRKYLKTSKPDRVISFVGRINALVLFASFGLKNTIIVSERNDPQNDGRSKLMLKICDLLYKRASTVIFQTKYQENCFSNSLKNHSEIIPNPVTVKSMPIEREKNRVVTVGRLCAQKNQTMFIDAAHILQKDHKNLVFEIYGEGALKDELNERIDAWNLTGAVRLMGNKTNIHDCINSATMFVLTSLYEGASNVLIEAMMLGLPCICTAYPGADEIISDGYNGILVPQNDSMALAEKIEFLLNDSFACKRLSEGAINSSQKYMSENVLKKWEDVILYGSTNKTL